MENTEKSPFQRFTVLRLRYRDKFHFKRFFTLLPPLLLYSTEIIEHTVGWLLSMGWWTRH